MSKSAIHTTGDSWKDIADKYPIRAGATFGPATSLITQVNDLWPFSTATGIFDTGCGPGVLTSLIIDQHGSELPQSAPMIAGDFSEPMLNAIRKARSENTKSAGDIWDRLSIQNIDAQHLKPLADGSVSHVVGGMVFFMLPNPRKALRESYRVLCDGGVLGLSSFRSSQWMDALKEASRRAKPGLASPDVPETWTTGDGVCGELSATGFTETKAEYVEMYFDYERHAQVADLLMTIPATKNMTQGFSEEESNGLRQAILDILAEKYPEEPGRLKGLTVVATGRKPKAA